MMRRAHRLRKPPGRAREADKAKCALQESPRRLARSRRDLLRGIRRNIGAVHRSIAIRLRAATLV
jgi:hypothetical protein